MADLLAVDDDQDMADLLADAPPSPTHAVRVANDGHEGLEQVAQRKPHTRDALLAVISAALQQRVPPTSKAMGS
jgi:DNA-binding response OmpR family regulator